MSVFGLRWGDPPAVTAEELPSTRLSDHFRRVGGYRPPRSHPDGWTEGQWRRAPVRRVRLDRLIATNRRLLAPRLAHHMRPGARPDGGDLPMVVAMAGQLWLIEGHHRAVCAMWRGETHLRAHVMEADQ